jgi:hypothetical protein
VVVFFFYFFRKDIIGYRNNDFRKSPLDILEKQKELRLLSRRSSGMTSSKSRKDKSEEDRPVIQNPGSSVPVSGGGDEGSNSDSSSPRRKRNWITNEAPSRTDDVEFFVTATDLQSSMASQQRQKVPPLPLSSMSCNPNSHRPQLENAGGGEDVSLVGGSGASGTSSNLLRELLHEIHHNLLHPDMPPTQRDKYDYNTIYFQE